MLHWTTLKLCKRLTCCSKRPICKGSSHMQWMHVVLSRPGFTVFSVSGLVATGARPLATIASPDFAPQTHGNISNRNAKVHVYIGISKIVKVLMKLMKYVFHRCNAPLYNMPRPSRGVQLRAMESLWACQGMPRSCRLWKQNSDAVIPSHTKSYRVIQYLFSHICFRQQSQWEVSLPIAFRIWRGNRLKSFPRCL